jgi:hypothetical protein
MKSKLERPSCLVEAAWEVAALMGVTGDGRGAGHMRARPSPSG